MITDETGFRYHLIVIFNYKIRSRRPSDRASWLCSQFGQASGGNRFSTEVSPVADIRGGSMYFPSGSIKERVAYTSYHPDIDTSIPSGSQQANGWKFLVSSHTNCSTLAQI
jgi:hypothetical protein